MQPDPILGFLRVAVELLIGGSLVAVVFWLLPAPIRRADRVQRFLAVLESAFKEGRPLEETLIAISRLGDVSLGVRFHLFAAWLERGLSFNDALAKVPRLLTPQIEAMLRVGQKIGDMRKVLPACRQLLCDAVSQTRGAINYLFILSFVITPFGVFAVIAMSVMVAPKFREIGYSIGGDLSGINFLLDHGPALIGIQIGLLLLVWIVAIVYMVGPRLAVMFPPLDEIFFRLPWRRKRLQRDFSTILAILLDSGVPEPEAVRLAADSTANAVFRRRAARVVESLQRGVNLPQAIQSMDDSGEFAWRLRNAFHGRAAFLQALAGWHESLDAKAYQQEQAASQGITTAMVLWTGLFVGGVAISVFTFLVSVLTSSALW